jgi:hypothetical protein
MKMRSSKRAIDKIYKRRDRYEIPDWQRQEVWTKSKKQNLIDSILQKWKLPKFYFLKQSDNPESYEVVDGQQRLTAILEFFDNELPLSEESTKKFEGKYYRDLPDTVSDAFDDYEIEYDEIEEATDEEIRGFFQRLQDGLPLTSSEKLNSINSKLRNFLSKLVKHKFFSGIGASDRRYGHFDILAKVAAIEIDGIEVGLRFEDLRAVFESQSYFSENSNVASLLNNALDFASKGFGNEASALRNRTIVQAVLTLICRLIKSPNANGKETKVRNFVLHFLKELNKQVELGQAATDTDYLEFQRTINANVKSGARIRQEILLRKLLAYDPEFAEVLDPASFAESGLPTAVTRDASDIARMISEINEQYSAQHGEDLFKPTNRTVQAQANIGSPLQGYDSYKNFIDDLYFLVKEGIGNRLGNNIPVSFDDVNILRTEIQHDVDHGTKSKTRAKKKKAGDTFRKYAGSPSAVGLDPSKFIIAQANVLAAIKADLWQLKSRFS